MAGMLWCGLMVLGAGVAYGQDFPTKPIRILTGSPGGSADVVSRAVGDVLTKRFNQTVVVENRPVTAADVVAKADADAYTLLLDGGSFWLAPLMQQTPYDVVRDYSPVSQVITSIYILVVHPSLPVTNIKELIALAKAKPGSINYGTSGVGAAPHLGTEMFNHMAGIKMVHVPYKGSAGVLTALLGGQEIHLAFVAGTLSMPHVNAGKLRAIGLANKVPSSLAPGIPLIMESGLPGFEFIQLLAVFAPAKTPVARVNLLSQEIRRALDTKEVKDRLLAIGLEAKGSTPQEMAALLKSEIAKWGKLVKDVGIKG